jgi:hypothetical protein
MGKTLFIQGVGPLIRKNPLHVHTHMHASFGKGERQQLITHVKRSHASQPSPTEPGKHGDRGPRYRRSSEAFAVLIWLIIASSPARGQARQEWCCLPTMNRQHVKNGFDQERSRRKQPVEMILSDAKVALVLTTSPTPGADRSAPAKFSRPAATLMAAEINQINN